MEQKDKELLLKDLCARLPYGVICRYYEPFTRKPVIQEFGEGNSDLIWHPDKYGIQPYLRDMEDITEEEYNQLYIDLRVKEDAVDILDALENDRDAIDWLNKKHFNWRGLPKYMYIRVTKENNPYKE